MQAEAAKIGAETLTRWARQKEGECTGAILQLKLNSIGEKSKQAGCSVAFRTTTPSETSLTAMVLKKGEIEANNSNIGNISLIKPSTSMSCNKMVLKEAMKQANKGKKWCKYCTKVCNCVNTNGIMYICSGKGIKGPGPPCTEWGSDK